MSFRCLSCGILLSFDERLTERCFPCYVKYVWKHKNRPVRFDQDPGLQRWLNKQLDPFGLAAVGLADEYRKEARKIASKVKK